MYKFLITGVVQGVGFRPYIYNACKEAGLKGYVQNIGTGVEVVVDNKKKLKEILKKTPPLARIDDVKISEITKGKQIYSDFSIKPSTGQGHAEIPPDLNLCEDCVNELYDSKNPRHQYFFITCTNCGPRFSMIKKTPYDRDTTTMNDFPMCENCLKDYKDPSNRRYHAQTTACLQCGPKLQLFINKKEYNIESSNLKKDQLALIAKTAELLKKGEIVSIKGNGGFHLASICKKNIVNKLRKLTNRPNKPYAVMCKDLNMARKFCIISDLEEKELASIRRPIVVLNKKKSFITNKDYLSVSELSSLGVMLPYSGLHYLLFDYINEPIIMTSSNLAGKPISTKRSEQLANTVLTHNRKIANRIDDSVVKFINKHKTIIRRSRGYVPQSFPLPSKLSINKTILALGAEENSTFAIYKEGKIYVSQFMGNVSKLENFNNLQTQVSKWLKMLKVKPDIILHDLHPSFQTTLLAFKLSKKFKSKKIAIQHHIAHIFSVAGEHNLNDFIGIACDGTGYGSDQKLWGGEIFTVRNKEVKRISNLEPQFQLGGDSAVREPVKMLFSILKKTYNKSEVNKILQDELTTSELNSLHKQWQEKYNCPVTTSCGRVLDAASTLLKICNKKTYQGRPSLLLESISGLSQPIIPIVSNNILQTTSIFKYLIENLQILNLLDLAATVQTYIATGLYQITKQYNQPIVFSGGVAYNNIISTFLTKNNVIINNKIPSGDGGISFGQIMYYLKTV